MKEKLKTAIVGVGKVTDIHAAALSRLDESEFTAVCSSKREKAEAFAGKYKIKKWFRKRVLM